MTKENFDQELIDLYVDEYEIVAQEILPDLTDSMEGCDTPDGPSDDDLRMGLEDCLADRIHDGERPNGHIPEIRLAAKAIAKKYV